MDNFVFGTIQENIKLLNYDVQSINSNIPKSIDDLSDVNITSTPANGEVLTYNSATEKFEPQAQSGGFSPSDDRLKFNERSIPNALQVINKLNPQVYEFAVGGLECNDRQTEAGFIAQDVEKIAEISYASRPPRGSGEDYYHLHYQTLFTYAVKAIQELEARIKVLESK